MARAARGGGLCDDARDPDRGRAGGPRLVPRARRRPEVGQLRLLLHPAAGLTLLHARRQSLAKPVFSMQETFFVSLFQFAVFYISRLCESLHFVGIWVFFTLSVKAWSINELSEQDR